ncbi:MAG TPA: threonine/serine dehydratase [Micromonosporaceae bacterium]|jgi:threonine dehydratase
MELVTLDAIRRAAKHLAGVVVRTPLLSFPAEDGLWLKPENLQPVGAFKLRGAYNAVACLPDSVRARGVLTHSSGNHGQALAYAARAFGVPCVVVMPDVAPAVKVAATRASGAEIVFVPPADRTRVAEALATERGMTVVPPYDHRDVIAGQGTVGLEIVEDMPDVDVVLVPVGGGGLASGVATAVKALRPAARVIGVEPELAADAKESLAAGRLLTWPVERSYRTMADGVRVNLSELTFAHLRERLDAVVTVSEQEIASAVGRLVRGGRIVVEPSGAVAAAARLFHRAELPAGRTVAVVSGGNIDPVVLAELVAADD